MQVAVSVIGRFHAFNLAQQMHKRDALYQLLTSYPKFVAKRFGIPGSKVSSCLWLEALMRGWGTFPKWVKPHWNPQFFFHRAYDRFSSQSLRPGADIFVGWSGSSLCTMQRAKTLGMVRVLERGSSHISLQQEILEEEYAQAGLMFDETHSQVIEQELIEYGMADYIAIPSLFVKRTFLDRGIAEHKLLHIPYGTDLSAFKPSSQVRDDNTFRLIFCGGLSLRKGVRYLLRAFAELRLPHSELWLVGTVSEPIKPFLAKYSSSNVIVHGPKPQSTLSWFYNQADAFCLPSVEEGLAMVLLQAMACGLPVVATTNTGGEDVIREGVDGFIVPIRDVEALKEKISWLYEHRERRRAMGQAARDRVSCNFSWNDYGSRLNEAYHRVAQR